MKKCFKCGVEKPLTEFYRHKQMADGYLNKCKDCTKKDSTNRRNKNLEAVREYDRNRGNRQGYEYTKDYRKKYPKKAAAHRKVNYELRKGSILKKPCEVCGAVKVVAHHDDYDRPLEIRWLCQAHHTQWHTKHGEGKNPV